VFSITMVDRYLLWLYLRVLLLSFTSLAGLLVIINLFSNLDDFIEYGKREGELTTILLQYYGPFLLSIFERLCGLLSMMSVLFVVAWLYRTNEFTALLAAGISKGRVVRPLLAGSVAVIVFAAVSREMIIPKYQDILDRKPQDLNPQLPRLLKPDFDRETSVGISGRHLLPSKNEVVDIALRLPPQLWRDGRQILAASAIYEKANDQHPAGYRLRSIHSPPQLPSNDDLVLGDKKVVLTAKQHNWLQPGECFLVTNVDFESLRGGNSWKQYGSTAELIDRLYRQNSHFSADVKVRVHSRFVQPILDMSLILLGLPVVLTRPDRHLFWVAGACFGVVAIFMGVTMAIRALGETGYLLEPAWAAWLPILLFLPYGFAKSRAAMKT
jgi:lipopolysaccharide export system permease protein